jgi:hypothetical protein
VIPADLIMPALTAVATAGAAWGAVTVKLNGTRHRVQEIEKRVNEMSRSMVGASERMARVETKMDLVLLDKALTDKRIQ